MLFDLANAPRVTAVLDWEFAHLGQPVEDLAWAEWIVPVPIILITSAHWRSCSPSLGCLPRGPTGTLRWFGVATT
jgi:hypothetical protein